MQVFFWYMTRKQISTAVAVVAGLAVVAIFFIFSNPFSMTSATDTPANSNNSAQAGSGLVVQDEAVGTGEVAQAGQLITVNYTGKLQDGTVFDTSIGRAPFQFMLGAGQVIPGWDAGLVGMKVGGKRLLIIPPAMAYGAQGAGPIPPNSTLIFEVDLLKVETVPQGAAAQ